jgi:hypothetical protein
MWNIQVNVFDGASRDEVVSMSRASGVRAIGDRVIAKRLHRVIEDRVTANTLHRGIGDRGSDIQTARPPVDEFNQPAVTLTLRRDAVARVSALATGAIAAALALLLLPGYLSDRRPVHRAIG